MPARSVSFMMSKQDVSNTEANVKSWQTFGHDQNKLYFEKLLANKKIGHAYIFEGPEGVGKTTFAKELASRLIEERLEASPNFLHIEPEKSVSIDDIRSIEKRITMKSSVGGYRVIIISGAERMTTEAQNAFLKTLEEPGEKVVIVLAVSNIRRLLPTIVSRCELMWFSPFESRRLKKAIEKIGGKDEGFVDAVALSGGSLGKALDLMKHEDRENILRTLSGIADGSVAERFAMAGKKDDMDRMKAIALTEMLIFVLRTSLLVQKGVIARGEANGAIPGKWLDMEPSKLTTRIKLAGFVKKALERNANYKLAMENLLLSI